MKTEYKYFRMEEVPTEGKTRRFNVVSKSDGGLLGEIKWHGPWRQYCLFSEYTIWNTGCMQDVLHFLAQLKRERT